MKAKLFLAAMLLFTGFNMMADEYNYLTITCNGTERAISLPTVQRISFVDSFVVVTDRKSVV